MKRFFLIVFLACIELSAMAAKVPGRLYGNGFSLTDSVLTFKLRVDYNRTFPTSRTPWTLEWSWVDKKSGEVFESRSQEFAQEKESCIKEIPLQLNLRSALGSLKDKRDIALRVRAYYKKKVNLTYENSYSYSGRTVKLYNNWMTCTPENATIHLSYDKEDTKNPQFEIYVNDKLMPKGIFYVNDGKSQIYFSANDLSVVVPDCKNGFNCYLKIKDPWTGEVLCTTEKMWGQFLAPSITWDPNISVRYDESTAYVTIFDVDVKNTTSESNTYLYAACYDGYDLIKASDMKYNSTTSLSSGHYDKITMSIPLAPTALTHGRVCDVKLRICAHLYDDQWQDLYFKPQHFEGLKREMPSHFKFEGDDDGKPHLILLSQDNFDLGLEMKHAGWKCREGVAQTDIHKDETWEKFLQSEEQFLGEIMRWQHETYDAIIASIKKNAGFQPRKMPLVMITDGHGNCVYYKEGVVNKNNLRQYINEIESTLDMIERFYSSETYIPKLYQMVR